MVDSVAYLVADDPWDWLEIWEGDEVRAQLLIAPDVDDDTIDMYLRRSGQERVTPWTVGRYGKRQAAVRPIHSEHWRGVT